MKKLFFFFLFVMPTFLIAQVELGFRAGLNMSEADLRTTNGDLLEAARLNGVNAGIFANIQLGKILAIQPEVAFSQKGFKASWNTSDSSATLNTSYLDMPVMFEAGVKLGKNFRAFANAGPNVSYLIDAEEQFYDALNDETMTVPYNFDTDQLERLDIGVNFGGGLSLRLNRWKYTLDVRYNMGMKEILATEDAMDFVNNAKHRVTNIAFGISYFVFGGKAKLAKSGAENMGKYY